MTYAPTTLSIFRLTHCIRIELHAAGVSLTEQFFAGDQSFVLSDLQIWKREEKVKHER